MTSTLSISDSGTFIWFNDAGKIHREDGPAVIIPGIRRQWHLNGKPHRLDGPAVIGCDGHENWWQNGERHRLDGPAMIYADGRQEWWQHGQKHRLDCPAIIYPDGTEEWWVVGRDITREVKQAMADCVLNPDWRNWKDTDLVAFRLLA